MALSTKLEIVNGALMRYGEETLTNLAGVDKITTLMNARYGPALRAVLALHPWGFAAKRVKLTSSNFPKSVSVTAITAANPPVVSAAGHTLANGEYAVLSGVEGMTQINGLVSVVANVAAGTFELSDIDASNFSAYTTGGTAGLAPAFDYTYYHALPSDYMRFVNLREGSRANLIEDWRVETNYIASNYETLYMKYVYERTEESVAPPLFAEALSAYLAWDTCYAITNSDNKKNSLWNELQQILAKARFVDSAEEPARTFESSELIESRIVNSVPYAST